MARRRKSKHPGWLVVATHYAGEFEARRELYNQGFEVELPLYRAPSRRSSDEGRGRPMPLFEGYVFVKQSDAWWRIRGTRGVSHLLMTCERPALLADDDLQFFVSISVDKNGYYVDPVMRMFQPGQTVSPVHGRFAGIAGQLCSLGNDGRTEILFRMMGREVRTREYRVSELA